MPYGPTCKENYMPYGPTHKENYMPYGPTHKENYMPYGPTQKKIICLKQRKLYALWAYSIEICLIHKENYML